MSEAGQIGPQIWRLTLAYDGTDFHGWQVQLGKPTIQGELQTALGRLTGEAPLPQGSGRTDAGVHALAQVASFPLNAPIPPENLRCALNRTLPSSIRISDARTMPSATFHARHSAVAKIYEYRIFRGEICSPFLARFACHCPWPMDFARLEASAQIFLGEHDFLSLAASDPDLAARSSAIEDGPLTGLARSAVRVLSCSAWERTSAAEGELWVYRVRGNGFLHHMVRNLVGTMLDVGRGQTAIDHLPEILAARNRSAAGPTAPPQGLFLHSVEYPHEELAISAQ
ncbi:MAG TPA: tRNA pseudouridine(38-40) synthase TruA [Terracidiphilus sp.]|jgi:tRNA pseudouridine38-40 synthase